jgi:outer membrane immunogenic protein
MRKFLLAAMVFGAATSARAADLPDLPVLRGSFPDGLSTASRNWDGWYAGGQVGYSSADMDFAHASKTLTNFTLRNSVLQAPIGDWQLLSRNPGQTTGFGAFVGRNWQWEELVFGLEANYNYMSNLSSSSTGAMRLNIANPVGENPPAGHVHTYDTTLSGSAALQIKDVLTFRGRAGWATGNFLPYVFGGLAVGRVDASRTATVAYDKYDTYDVTVGGNTFSQTDFLGHTSYNPSIEHKTNQFVAGWTGGLGLEYMLWGNVFVRAEWEYIKFLSVKDINFSTNSARAGIGYKF